MLESDYLEDFLQTLADAALELSHSEGAGLTLQRDGRPLTVVSAGTAATTLDEKQYGQDDGPCLHALRTGEELRINDMYEETRWDDYPTYATACGNRWASQTGVVPSLKDGFVQAAGRIQLHVHGATPRRRQRQQGPVL
ncbi:GAF domain-containing protein [Streptomyces sp. NPDC006602]|uniref:GAF domain-containing protein n=1 Tax=Streptomyces sp. NPDC006602 TaxID=3364751 RepID=UPI003687802C